jgi:hypothetical protein
MKLSQDYPASVGPQRIWGNCTFQLNVSARRGADLIYSLVAVAGPGLVWTLLQHAPGYSIQLATAYTRLQHTPGYNIHPATAYTRVKRTQTDVLVTGNRVGPGRYKCRLLVPRTSI